MRHRSTLSPRGARLSRPRASHQPRLRDFLRVHPARLLLGVLVTVGITALFLAVPVVSGKGSDAAPVALESSASAAQTSSGSPVVMGEDGVPVPVSAPGATATTTAPRTSAAATSTAAPPPAPTTSSSLVVPSAQGVAAGSAGGPGAGGGSSATGTTSASSSQSSAAPTSATESRPSDSSGPTALPTDTRPVTGPLPTDPSPISTDAPDSPAR